MRFVSGAILSVSVLAGLLTAVPAWPEQAPAADAVPSCEVQDYLLASDSALPKTAEAIKDKSLNILVVGSRSSTINLNSGAAESAAYPGQMLIALKEKLPQVTINLSVEIQAKKNAEEIVPGLPKLLEEKKPTLVVWQTGTVDAVHSVDPDDFRTAVGEGISALQQAGAEVILMNPQYSPRTESMISVAAYLDNMRVVAQERDVPLFDRFSIMQGWSESGAFDLFSTAHNTELARHVHSCLGRALSQFIIGAAHPVAAQQN